MNTDGHGLGKRLATKMHKKQAWDEPQMAQMDAD